MHHKFSISKQLIKVRIIYHEISDAIVLLNCSKTNVFPDISEGICCVSRPAVRILNMKMNFHRRSKIKVSKFLKSFICMGSLFSLLTNSVLTFGQVFLAHFDNVGKFLTF